MAHVEDFGATHNYASFRPIADIWAKCRTIRFCQDNEAGSIFEAGTLVYPTSDITPIPQATMGTGHTEGENSADPSWNASMQVDLRNAHRHD
jgi:hypothetical protein